MTNPAWYPYAPDQVFGRQGAIDQVRLDNFLAAVGQMDVPVTMAGALDAATDVRAAAIRNADRESR